MVALVALVFSDTGGEYAPRVAIVTATPIICEGIGVATVFPPCYGFGGDFFTAQNTFHCWFSL